MKRAVWALVLAVVFVNAASAAQVWSEATDIPAAATDNFKGTPGFFRGLQAYWRQDYATALKEWRPLAMYGAHSISQYYLGVLHYQGQGVPQDHAEAKRLFLNAAEKGNVDAQRSLAAMHSLGEGGPKDDAKAAKWYRRAAEQGHVEAQYFLGWHYLIGQGVLKDYVRAYMWLNLAAASGHKGAAEKRDAAGQMMTAVDVSRAQRLAQEWLEKHPK